jgi:hypothetical protein
MTEEQLTTLEESAFYESGLSAHGCLEKLDSYAREAIRRYGRCLLQNQKEINDLKNEELQKLARKLYGTVLHVFVLAKEDPLILVGPTLYQEAAEGAKEYEEFNGQFKR